MFVSLPFCPGCGGELDGVLEICRKCLREEKRLWKKAVSVFRMTGTAQELIHRYKYSNTPEMARPFGKLAAEALIKNGIKVDFIVPTPLHWLRSFLRGFNQATLLAEVISEETGIPVMDIMKRTKWTKQQARLSRKERKKNLKGAFSVKKQEICKNRSILLLDDVMTTGSTLSAAAAELMKAGAHEINVLVLGRR